MSWSLQVFPNVRDALAEAGASLGVLVVATDKQSQQLLVVGSVPAQGPGPVEKAAAQIQKLLPYGLSVLGTYTSGPSAKAGVVLPQGLPSVTATGAGSSSLQWQVDGQTQAVKEVSNTPEDSNISKLSLPGFSAIRTHASLQLQVQGTKVSEAALQQALQQLQTSLFTPDLVFMNTPGISTQPQLVSSSSNSGTTVGTVLTSSSSPACPCASFVPMVHSSSKSSSSSTGVAPMFEFQPEGGQQGASQITSLTLGMDVLAYAPDSMPLAKLVSELLVPALQQQLVRLVEQLGQQEALVPISAHHFLPLGWAHPISCSYPQVTANAETNELKLTPLRQELHQLLGLPNNMPLLRLANALVWQAPAVAGEGSSSRPIRLLDVHATLPVPAFEGNSYLINGHYEYYHYMQDRFNDAGWGCAYRSLQTIFSWFRQQRYSNKPVPTHREIQETLVRIGDKEASFVGSSNWVGAIELSYLLDEYMGITSKVITVNKGSEIPSYARQLAAHFQTQGTPVMIGGGVLAYTLLGVRFNEQTGECAFLILDPHYTGGEDLRKIHQGTWVAWKKPEDSAAAGGPLFVKDAFYNFLCPQRPNTV